MRVLREGLRGEDVRAWETFLVGLGHYTIDVDGVFDENTREATEAFQRSVGLNDDGVVGMRTMGQAANFGFDPLDDVDLSEEGPNWPPRPSNLVPLGTNEMRQAVFGKFAFRPSPAPYNREAITITDGWDKKNIVLVEIPQLVGVVGATRRVPFHKELEAPVKKLFAAWEEAGLIDLVKSWAGSWVPRFQRGSSTTLSNHSWGTAFDINVPWNGLGVQPALVGRTGSVRRLVPIANELGWFWGGHFTRKDGMHFEATSSTA